MDLTDARWSGLKGGYRLAHDPRGALRALDGGGEPAEAWAELWNELHHQGDVGEASYAAVPAIAELLCEGKVRSYNAYALAMTIEECRRANPSNPPVPTWLEQDYAAAWRKLFDVGLASLHDAEGEELVSSILAVIAYCKGLPMLARIAASTSESERIDLIEEAGWI